MKINCRRDAGGLCAVEVNLTRQDRTDALRMRAGTKADPMEQAAPPAGVHTPAYMNIAHAGAWFVPPGICLSRPGDCPGGRAYDGARLLESVCIRLSHSPSGQSISAANQLEYAPNEVIPEQGKSIFAANHHLPELGKSFFAAEEYCSAASPLLPDANQQNSDANKRVAASAPKISDATTRIRVHAARFCIKCSEEMFAVAGGGEGHRR